MLINFFDIIKFFLYELAIMKYWQYMSQTIILTLGQDGIIGSLR